MPNKALRSFHVRLPAEDLDEAARLAEMEERSLNYFIAKAVKAQIKSREKEAQPA